MGTHFLDTFTKYSDDSPLPPWERKADCFVKDERGISFYQSVNLWDESGGTFELRHELLKSDCFVNAECAQAIASKLKKNSKEEYCQLIAKIFLDELPDQWVVKSSEIKPLFSLGIKHLRLIEEANSLGFLLDAFQPSRRDMRLGFSRSSPPLSFVLGMMKVGDKVEFIRCEPIEKHDPSHRLGIDPYPVDLGNGFSIVRQGDQLRAHHVQGESLAWASKPYKTYRGARSCAVQRMKEEPARRIREQLQEEKIVEWLKANRTRVVGHVHRFGRESGPSWLEDYIFETTGEIVQASSHHIFQDNGSDELIICGWPYPGDRPRSIPSLNETSAWLSPALNWLVGNGDRPSVPVTGQAVLDWMKKLEKPPA